MRRRHLPALWLITDERIGEAPWRALERLPRGAGVIFRHYTAPDRRAAFDQVRVVARRRRLVLLLAGPPQLAVAWRADGAHGRSPHRRVARRLIRTAPCHDRRALVAARAADLRLVSPIFATRSHPGARVLGPVRAGLMVTGERHGLIALGGMSVRRARRMHALGFDRWAAIDALQRGTAADPPGRLAAGAGVTPRTRPSSHRG